MWMLILLLHVFPIQDQEVPYLSSEEYTYEVDYFLKRKPPGEKQVYDINAKRTSGQDVLPYVKLHFTFKRFEDSDNKIIIYRGGNRLSSKKIKGPMKITLDMGFAVDMKEGVEPADFTIMIYQENSDPRARILVEVKENGEMYINGVRSGMI